MFIWHTVLFFFLIEAFTVLYAIGEIGFFNTLFIWLCAAVAGIFLIQRQGLAMLVRAQAMFEGKPVPVDNLFGGICTVIAGLLLLAPGFLGDILAVMLLIPFIRNLLKAKFPNYVHKRTSTGAGAEDSVIDGTYVRVEEPVEAIEQHSAKPPKDNAA